MAEPILRMTHGEDSFDFANLMAHEMSKVKGWTGLKNRREFFAAIRDEDGDAVMAAFALVAMRRGEQPRWGDIRVNFDNVRSYFVDDTGREIEVVVETDDDGAPLLVRHDDGVPARAEDGSYIADPAGRLVACEDSSGIVWRYADTGERVPPTPSPETTSSPATRNPSTDSSATSSGTPTIDAP